MKVALDHHYGRNRHHPEHFNTEKLTWRKYFTSIFKLIKRGRKTSSLNQMDLIDITEMLMDWWAASKRHEDGDIFKSIEINQNRFGYSADVKHIFINTIKRML